MHKDKEKAFVKAYFIVLTNRVGGSSRPVNKYTAVARAACPITCHKHAKESSCTTGNANTG